MVRTQIYLPEETHATLLELAKMRKTTLSELIRQGAVDVIKRSKKRGRKVLSPQQKALQFFANPPKKYQVKLSKSAVDLVRDERD